MRERWICPKRKKKKSFTNSSFVSRKKSFIGLKKLQDEKSNVITENIFRINEEEDALTSEQVLDLKLKAFFEQIRMLKNLKSKQDEEKLISFIDGEVNKVDYSVEKKIEARKYNFFEDLKVNRMANNRGKVYNNNKLVFHDPLTFNVFKDDD